MSHLETIDGYKPPTMTGGGTDPQPLPVNPPKPASEMTLDSSAEHEPHRHRNYDDDDEEDENHYDLYSEEKEWDEGGKSHCGYSEFVHSTLMTVGGAVHKVVGDPSPKVERELKAVGNWFQEASYAARDLVRGNPNDDAEGGSGMKEDAWDAVKTLVRGGPKKKKTTIDENGAAVAAAEQQNNNVEPTSIHHNTGLSTAVAAN